VVTRHSKTTATQNATPRAAATDKPARGVDLQHLKDQKLLAGATAQINQDMRFIRHLALRQSGELTIAVEDQKSEDAAALSQMKQTLLTHLEENDAALKQDAGIIARLKAKRAQHRAEAHLVSGVEVSIQTLKAAVEKETQAAAAKTAAAKAAAAASQKAQAAAERAAVLAQKAVQQGTKTARSKVQADVSMEEKQMQVEEKNMAQMVADMKKIAAPGAAARREAGEEQAMQKMLAQMKTLAAPEEVAKRTTAEEVRLRAMLAEDMRKAAPWEGDIVRVELNVARKVDGNYYTQVECVAPRVWNDGMCRESPRADAVHPPKVCSSKRRSKRERCDAWRALQAARLDKYQLLLLQQNTYRYGRAQSGARAGTGGLLEAGAPRAPIHESVPVRLPHRGDPKRDLGDNRVGGLQDLHAHASANDDVQVPLESATASWRAMADPMGAWVGTPDKPKVPLFAQGAYAPREVQKTLQKKPSLARYADKDDALGFRSPVSPENIKLMFGEAAPFLADKYMFPGDSFPSPAQLAKQRGAKAHGASVGHLSFPKRSKAAAALKRAARPALAQGAAAPCELPLCSPLARAEPGAGPAPAGKVRVCTGTGCKLLAAGSLRTLARQDDMQAQVEQGQIAGQADPFGLSRAFSDARVGARRAAARRQSAQFYDRALGGEPVSDFFVRGWPGLNGVTATQVADPAGQV